jgi:hypothetical protein
VRWVEINLEVVSAKLGENAKTSYTTNELQFRGQAFNTATNSEKVD